MICGCLGSGDVSAALTKQSHFKVIDRVSLSGQPNKLFQGYCLYLCFWALFLLSSYTTDSLLKRNRKGFKIKMKFMKLGSKADSFQRDGNNMRYVAAELATDFVVHVGDVKFYLHKFPLLSKSARLQKLVTGNSEHTNDEVHIPDIPGGASAFEICAKFCYGMVVTLNPYNVVAVRCAAEYLEMHEVVEKGNLVQKIEVFLSSSIFRTWKDSILALQSTRSLFPWTEELKVVSRCVDGVACKASVDPATVDWSYTYNRKKHPADNGTDHQWNGVQKPVTVPKDWWVEDLCELEVDLYKRVILAIKSKGRMSGHLIGEALKAYSLKWLPAFDRDQVNGSEAVRYRSLVETVIWLLPAGRGNVPCGFMLKLLKAGTLLDIGETAKIELVKKIGKQLDEAATVDLLLPAPSGEMGLYDVDTVQNIVEEFFRQEHNVSSSQISVEDELPYERTSSFVSYASKIAAAKVVDGYLAEIACDQDLPLSKFVNLAETVTKESRPVHDALYRAIDMYLKEHPSVTKSEKKMICKLMDCKKLSLAASMHAAQNDKLPLRVVVQVLFFEQIRTGAAGAMHTLLPDNGGSHESSQTATSNTEEDWDVAQMTSEELRAIKGELAAVRIEDDKRGSGNTKNTDTTSGKVRGILKSSRFLSKLQSNKEKGDNGSSDLPESPVSQKPGDAKSPTSRNWRNSSS